jgi:Acetyltransferase (GNAT) family.
LVGTISEWVVAIGGLLPLDEEGVELKRLRVRQDVQGRGVGESITRALLDRARALELLA